MNYSSLRLPLAGVSMAAVLAVAIPSHSNPLDQVPDPLPPALKYLESSGVKLTYLGDQGGLEGYMGESSLGKVQTFYVTPDGEHVVAGVLFRNGGINVTGVQVEEMKDRFERAREKMEGVEEDVSSVSMDEAGEMDSLPTLPGLTPLDETQEQEEIPTLSENQYASDIEAQKFLQDVEEVAWFSVGLDNAPVMYMVADPQCPFCHAAWSELRPMVMNGEVNLRIILIDALAGSRDKVISLLAREEPGRAWFAGEGSIAGMQIASPPEMESEEYDQASRYLMVNKDFATQYEFDATPYLIYQTDQGELRVSRGLPQDFNAFVSDLPTNDALSE